MRLGGLSYSSGTENRYRYNGKEYHQELGLGLYDYGARMYDPSIGRWNGVDALADSFYSWNPYHYAVNSPLSVTDYNGMDTLIMHIAFNLDKSTEQTAVFNVTFSLVSSGVEAEIELDEAMSMISDRQEDKRGDNSLSEEKSYKLTFDQMSAHMNQEGWENTIRVTNFGVFIHPGTDFFDFGGCKGVTCELKVTEGEEPRTDFDKSKSALQKVRNLYDSQDNLTGDKFLLKPNSTATYSVYRNKKERTKKKIGPHTYIRPVNPPQTYKP